MKKYRYTGQQPYHATHAGTDINVGLHDEVELDAADPHIANLIAVGLFVEVTGITVAETKNKTIK